MVRICSNLILSALFLCLFSKCVENNTDTDKSVECRLYWIGDTYPITPENAKEPDVRLVNLHYIIINNTPNKYFLPIKKSIFGADSSYCSNIYAYINKEPIHTWFSTDTRWNGILNPADSIRANLKIPEWVLDSIKIDKRIILTELLNMLNIRYDRCLSDTVFSTFPMPQLRFTRNDTVVIHYRDTTTNLSNITYCP